MMRLFFLFVYYGFARYLPLSYRFGGPLWKGIRSFICRRLFASCGENINVDRGVLFLGGRHVSLGNNSSIGPNAQLNGKITIGDDVMIGPDLLVLIVNHAFSRTDIPMRAQGVQEEKPVTIGNDVWIGARVTILPGVKIGNGVVVGACSVVTKPVPDWAVVAGNPARIIKFRKESGHPVDKTTTVVR